MVGRTMRVFARSGGAGLAAAFLVVAPDVAPAQEAASRSPAEVCLAASPRINLGSSLPRTATRLRAGELRVVAVGSSSTTGLWVLHPGGTYPEVMARELMTLRPSARVEMVNSGRVGDTIGGMIRRFDRDVIAHRPDLVVWQLGTNDVAWGGGAEGLKDAIIGGVRTLKASGADVILMDLQYAPAVLWTSQHTTMQSAIAETARQERVGLFSRFALMRRSIDAGLSPGALVSWDGLHNSAAGYDCVGRALARAVDAGVR